VKVKDTHGRSAKFSGITIAKYKDGKLIEGWNGFDFIKMYQQLGLELK
jgi:predicted ester cyclase